jgi:hypothetical protein
MKEESILVKSHVVKTIDNTVRVMVMVFNATFNNISVISWLSVCWLRKPEYPGKTTYLPQITDNFIT